MTAIHDDNPTTITADARTRPCVGLARRGFTLIELMAVVSLVGVVVAAGAVMIAQASRARQGTDRAIDAGAQADAAIGAVVAAVRNTLRPRGDEEEGTWFFTGEDGTLDSRPADTLRFLTVDHRPVRSDQPESDVREVEFTLEPGDGGTPFGGPALPYLRRRMDPTLTLVPDGGGVADRVAENVIAFDVEYFDGQFWQIEWPEALQTMPTAMRIRVAVIDPQRPGAVIEQRRVVHLPHLPTLRDAGLAATTIEENDDTNETEGGER